ncbi:uncharacterized protein LOC129600392 [Paramacrobiotus metropolitanus]|uniref:uncharacterized protein LOC129600392 n=1 Tax=Paramacrobiotus metropolitanus TaxID=2943436 RepID=UPI0024462883|nr:uncharacterized protein LOC129600392 [Paramacrobiotus metropolitanus]
MYFIISVIFLAIATEYVSAHEPDNVHPTNSISMFGRWNKSAIYYCLDSSYAPLEVATINNSIHAMMVAVPCLTFIPVSCSDTVYKVHITPYTSAASSTLSAVSFSFPGMHLEMAKNSSEQVLCIARDTQSCSVNERCVLKFLAVLLGKRNEHQRGDRDQYITVNYKNLLIPSTYRRYSTDEAYWQLFPYDYCSITHNQPTDYAMAGTVAFSVAAGARPGCVPALNTISNTDCRLISLMYQCNTSQCAALDCENQHCPSAAATGVSVATSVSNNIATTLTMETTTTSKSINGKIATIPPCASYFCATPTPKIDEASLLYDNRYFMFSGDCAVQIDESNKIIGESMKISSLFPGVSGPVKSVWTDQMTGVTSVVTAAAEYACLASGCTPVSPMNATAAPRFEFAVMQSTRFDAYNYAISITGDTYINEQTSHQKPLSSITCLPATGPSSTPCKIKGAWNAAYMLRLAGFNMVSVIGTDGADPEQYLQVMQYTGTEMAPDTFQFLTTGIRLRDALQCSP